MDKLTFGGTHSPPAQALSGSEPCLPGDASESQASLPLPLAPGPWGEMVPGQGNKPRSQRDRDRIVTLCGPCSLWKRML